MDQPWQIEMFGWLRVVQADRVVSRFRTRKTGALLAYLACYQHRSHPREQLIELLWPECLPSAGRANLRGELPSLRRQLEPPGVPHGAVLLASGDTLQLNPAACTTDVAAFEAALAAAERTASPAERAKHLLTAAELYRGELLPGYFEDWILPERQRLAEAFLEALHTLAALLEELGERPRALQWARRAVAADPLCEESYQLLIRLLAADGQFEAARAQYEQGEQLLDRELGSTLSPEIHALVKNLPLPTDRPSLPSSREPRRQHRGSAPGPRAAPAASGAETSPAASGVAGVTDARDPFCAADRPTHSLPLRFTRFFGREGEITTLVGLLGEMVDGSGDSLPSPDYRLPSTACRLVTMAGPGGTGKTRLAVEVAARLRDVFPDGVWFVPLQELTDPALIPDQILLAMHLPRSPEREPMEQVVTFLSRAPALLLLDNFEHLVEGGAEIARHLLERVASLTLLVTSRQRLGLEGEREFPVGPLPVPGPRDEGRGTRDESELMGSSSPIPPPSSLVTCPSVALFADRAQAVRPDFQVTGSNAGAVAQICRRLEGLPLALELAAARAGVLTPAQMLDRLAQRFELLASTQRGVAPRHRSLRATLEWSYQLLSPELQQFFARLSVFQGGWTLEAAEAVCDEPNALRYLEQLRECSLVQAAETVHEMRFRLLETLREYGAEQLALEERTVVAHRHASYYLAVAERAEPELVRADQVAWFDRLERELDNLRAALAWLEGSRRIQEALRLGAALRELITPVAGDGTPGYSGDNSFASQARLHQPSGLAFDAAGDLYIADVVNYRVRKVGLDGTITTVAGTGKPGFSSDGSKATDAQLNGAGRVVLDGAGELFISDFRNHRVRKVTPDGIITTVAGSGPVDASPYTGGDTAKNGGFSGDNGPATEARLNGPVGLAVDAHGNLFIGDYLNHRVRKVDAAMGLISTVAGNGQPGSSGDGGLATDAQLNGCVALVVDSASNLFIADNLDNRVRKVTPDGIITPVAGTGKAGFTGDGGKATDAQLNAPQRLAVDSIGNLFIADNSNNRVRKVSPEGMITTVAGNGKTKYEGDGGLATETGLKSPNSLALDAMGNLLIADDNDERLLKVFGVAAPGLLAGKAFPQ